MEQLFLQAVVLSDSWQQADYTFAWGVAVLPPAPDICNNDPGCQQGSGRQRCSGSALLVTLIYQPELLQSTKASGHVCVNQLPTFDS